jgi:hypothetical protein
MAVMSPQVVSVAGLTPVYSTPTVSDTVARTSICGCT